MNSVYNNFINNTDNNIIGLEKDLESLINNDIEIPKNSGKIWNKKDRKMIIKILNKNNDKIENIYTDKIIYTISEKLGRSNNSILNEIKKVIFNKFLEGKEFEEISNELNIEEENINLIIKLYDDGLINKQINFFEKQNKLLKLKLENINLRKEIKKNYS
jgi:hypothetical protein